MAGTKPIRFTDHACFEMLRRGIQEADVNAVIRSPDQVLSSHNGRVIYQTKIAEGERLLRVVVKEDGSGYDIITVYETSRIAKYWKPL